jgi:DNA-binding response OmpR family regulator
MSVLILEDDPFATMTLQDALADIGEQEIVSVHSVAQAMQLEEQFDFAVLDVNVPDGKTFEVAFDLKECAVPFVFVSGSDPHAVPEELRDALFLKKPLDVAVLQRAVRSFRSRRQVH